MINRIKCCLFGVFIALLFFSTLPPLRAVDETAQTLFNQAASLLAEGDSTGALGLLDKALELDPRHGEVLIWRGWLNLISGNLKQARNDFKQALTAKSPKIRSLAHVGFGHLGIYRDTVEVTPYEHGRFNVSQIVLATNITQVEKGQKPGKFARGRLNVMALPSRTFSRDQKVFIYCEVYYLNKDNQGRKRYNIDFSIKADKLDKGLVSKIFTPFGKLLRKKEDISSITLTFDKEQENPDRVVQPEYISIDIIESPPGRYDLNITVTDNATGEKVTRDANFSIVKAR